MVVDDVVIVGGGGEEMNMCGWRRRWGTIELRNPKKNEIKINCQEQKENTKIKSGHSFRAWEECLAKVALIGEYGGAGKGSICVTWRGN